VDSDVTTSIATTSTDAATTATTDDSDDSDDSDADTSTTGPVDPTTGLVDPTTGLVDPTTGDPTDATTGGPCEPDLMAAPCMMLSINGNNYLMCEQPVGWTEAVVGCEQRCARLVMFTEHGPNADPESEKLLFELRTLMNDNDKAEEQELEQDEGAAQPQSERASWWIGGHRPAGEWVWLTGEPMPAQSKGGWAEQHPGQGIAAACAALAVYGLGGDNGRWFDRDCMMKHRYLCELP
jgi:hypothetical protein